MPAADGHATLNATHDNQPGATSDSTTTSAAPAVVPLCVDLDGTLIHSDLLLESTLALLRRNPLYLLWLPIWLFGGRAHLKREIARRTQVDVATLPWDTRVLELLRAEGQQRPLVLCTASDQAMADAVARHLGLFTAVMASDGARNLSGQRKAEALTATYGDRGFDYAGNERRDMAIWQHARRAYVVNASGGVAAQASEVTAVAAVLPRQPAGLRDWLKALRLHQWVKNALVFVPLLAAHKLLQGGALAHAIAAFFIFGICASSVYVLNDLLDLGADRAHPRKRKRPFAAGRLSLTTGLSVAPLLTVIAFVAAYLLDPRFALVLLGYYILTLAYSLRLKQIVMLDVLVLAALYTVRIIAGTVVIDVDYSFWLLAFSMFLFLSLAMLKRYAELSVMFRNSTGGVPGRGYSVADIPLVQSLGGASGYLSVLVLALYINSMASAALYRHPRWLWLLCPLLLYWVSRVWIIAYRGAMHDDPVVFAIRDKISRVVLVLAVIVVLLAIR